jgi:hypothetical protein
MVVNKLEEAINLLVPDHKGIFKNKIIKIEKELTKNDRIVGSQISQTFGSGVNISIQIIRFLIQH